MMHTTRLLPEGVNAHSDPCGAVEDENVFNVEVRHHRRPKMLEYNMRMAVENVTVVLQDIIFEVCMHTCLAPWCTSYLACKP